MAQTYLPIGTNTLGSTTSSVTFNSVTGYTDLVLEMTAVGSGSSANPFIRFNGDTGTNYSVTALSGDGTNPSTSRAVNQTWINIGNLAQIRNSLLYRSTTHIMSYSNAIFKTTLCTAGNASYGADLIVGCWRSTAAITSVSVHIDAGNFAVGSSFTIYGIKGA